MVFTFHMESSNCFYYTSHEDTLILLDESHVSKMLATYVSVGSFSRAQNYNFFQGAQLHFQSYLKVLCLETCKSLGFLLKFEGAAGEFN